MRSSSNLAERFHMRAGTAIVHDSDIGRPPSFDRPGGDVSAGLSDHAAEISESIIAVMRAHNSLRARLTAGAEADLGAVILLVKLAKQGPRRAGELAEAMCADPSTVSRQVASLVRAGLIERKADPDDGRASLLAITERGYGRVREFVARRSRAAEPIIANWSVEDRKNFARLLRTYSEGLEEHREEVLACLAANPLGSPATTHSERSFH